MSSNNDVKDPLIDEEIELASDKLALYVSPWGASLRGLVANGVTDLVTRYKGKDKTGGEGDVLIPFPGRIRDGRYVFQGKEYQLHKNDGEGPNAIHGFLRNRPWNVTKQTKESVTFSVDLKADEAVGYPFALQAEVTYELDPSGFKVSYAVENIGSTDAPIAAGFHPYFSVGASLIDDTMLTLPFKSILVYENMLPTGQVVPASQSNLDFQQERLISDTKFNTCFLDPIRDSDGRVAITLRTTDAGRSLSVILGPEINYVVLYSGDPLPESHRRKSLAIEPMSCGSDAFNYPEWGLATVKPGEALTGTWQVRYHSTL